MPIQEAREEAIRRAKARLAELLSSGSESAEERCSRLGLGHPSGKLLEFRAFGSPARFDLSTLDLRGAGGEELPQADRILFYHYLACESAPRPGGDPVSFRGFPGGAFYWEPFRSRTALPLAARFGADLGRGAPGLRSALARFDWSELALGDFGARVHGFGNLYLILAAYAPEAPGAAGAAGLGADFNVLFESAALRAFGAEDAAAFASRICLALLKPAM